MTAAELSAYQTAAWATAMYPDKGQGTSIYPYLQLCGEAGEVAELIGKRIRDGVTDEAAWRMSLLKELGDVLWYCAAIATEKNESLQNERLLAGGHLAFRLCAAAVNRNTTATAYIVEQIAIAHNSTLAEVATMNLAMLRLFPAGCADEIDTSYDGTVKRIHHYATGGCDMDRKNRLRIIAKECEGLLLRGGIPITKGQ